MPRWLVNWFLLGSALGSVAAASPSVPSQEPGAAELIGQARLTFLAYAGAATIVDSAVAGERVDERRHPRVHGPGEAHDEDERAAVPDGPVADRPLAGLHRVDRGRDDGRGRGAGPRREGEGGGGEDGDERAHRATVPAGATCG